MTNIIEILRHWRRESAWQDKFEPLAPRLGDMAPDFELRDSQSTHAVRLSEFRGSKPVALVFGSFT